MAIGHHHKIVVRVIDFVAHSARSLNADAASFPLHGFGLCDGAGLAVFAEVGVVPDVAEDTTVARIQSSNRSPSHFAGLMSFVSRFCWSDTLIDEEKMAGRFGEFRHGVLTVVDVFLTDGDCRGSVDSIVKSVIVFERKIVAGLFEEAVEGEEVGQVLLCHFAAEACKAEIVCLGISTIDGLFAEFVEKFAEEGGFLAQFDVVEPQLPIHARTIAQIHVKP